MGANSKIAWTHHTFNPWVGCQRISPGCTNCYAEAYDQRVGGLPKSQRKDPEVPEFRWGPKAPRVRTSAATWREPLRWNRAAAKAGERHRVFCASLADVFEDRPELVEWRAELFHLIAATPHLDWLLLTKRPHQIERLWPGDGCPRPGAAWPNVWLGTTVEDQQRANERIPALLSVPAKVRFLSCEPLLERVTLPKICLCGCGKTVDAALREPSPLNHEQREATMQVGLGIDWVIIGGESGPGARPFDLDWARDLVRQCRSAGVAPFVKQLGARPRAPITGLHDEYTRVHLTDPAGADPDEWPDDLRVREFPR